MSNFEGVTFPIIKMKHQQDLQDPRPGLPGALEKCLLVRVELAWIVTTQHNQLETSRNPEIGRLKTVINPRVSWRSDDDDDDDEDEFFEIWLWCLRVPGSYQRSEHSVSWTCCKHILAVDTKPTSDLASWRDPEIMPYESYEIISPKRLSSTINSQNKTTTTTRWALWMGNWGCFTFLIGVITSFLTGWGPPCRVIRNSFLSCPA